MMSGQRAAVPPGVGSRSGREARGSRLTFAGGLSQMAFADHKPTCTSMSSTAKPDIPKPEIAPEAEVAEEDDEQSLPRPEDEPAKPSAAIQSAEQTVSEARGECPTGLRRQLAGDLDTVVLNLNSEVEP